MMDLATEYTFEAGEQDIDALPVVIIGAGPVGVRVVQLLLKANPQQPIVIYGNEPWEPYNRVRLSQFLSGELSWFELVDSQRIPEVSNVIHKRNCNVIEIDRQASAVVDETGARQVYSKLVIATGSSPHVPNLPGIDKKHIYYFRSLSDVEQLSARRVKSRRTVIIGGGLLGLEAARAMQRQNTDVTVIDHALFLMSQQLDETAAELLREKVMSMGVKVYLGNGVSQFLGDDSVTGIELRNGSVIECDTVIVSAGIRPNIDLARAAKISVGRGIRVNDLMQTSDPDIYAVGECAEHRGIVYGLVAPGYEQAGVVVNSLLERKSKYQGSITATKLKVVNETTFSMGEAIIDEDPGHFYSQIIYLEPAKGIYRKLVVKNGRLVGAIALGDWEELSRIQEVISKHGRIWPWQLRRFRRHGLLWPEQVGRSVTLWPASAKVCQCMGVSRGQLTKAIGRGCSTLDAIQKETGASTVCGGCKPLISDMLGQKPESEKLKFTNSVMIISLLAMLLAILIGYSSPIPYPENMVNDFEWDKLWRDKTFKQISGYSLLGVSILALGLSISKRIFKVGSSAISLWRLIHIIAGVFLAITLISHTGFRLGEKINLYLMVDFLLLLIVGGIAGIFMAKQHLLDAIRAMKIKKAVVWGHILSFWPLPVLLGFHIIQTYYF